MDLMTGDPSTVAVPAVRPPLFGAALPVAPQPVRRKGRVHRRISAERWLKRAVVVVLVAFVGLLVYERLITGLMHDQRQRHLAAAIASGRPKVSNGDAFGVIQIPTLGVNEVIVVGANATNLRSGPAVSVSSVLPGQRGALVVFGHRSVYGGPFKGVPELKQGDNIYVEARNRAPVITYTVTGVRRYPQSELAAGLPPASDRTSTLVLVTGAGGWSSDDSFVVTATTPDSVAGGPTTPRTISLLATDPDEPSGLFLLYGNLGLMASALTWRLLKARGRSLLVLAVLAPVALVAFLWLALFADSLLAATR